MPRPAPHDGLDKFRRYRANRRVAGMKLARIWVTDPRLPENAEKARREADLLRGAPDEQDALDFIERLMQETDDEA